MLRRQEYTERAAISGLSALRPFAVLHLTKRRQVSARPLSSPGPQTAFIVTGFLGAHVTASSQSVKFRSLGRGPRRQRVLMGSLSVKGAIQFQSTCPPARARPSDSAWTAQHSADYTALLCTPAPTRCWIALLQVIQSRCRPHTTGSDSCRDQLIIIFKFLTC